MTNHVQIDISKLMQTLGRLYIRYFDYGYQRTGALFEGRYKSSVVQQEEYIFELPEIHRTQSGAGWDGE